MSAPAAKKSPKPTAATAQAEPTAATEPDTGPAAAPDAAGNTARRGSTRGTAFEQRTVMATREQHAATLKNLEPPASSTPRR